MRLVGGEGGSFLKREQQTKRTGRANWEKGEGRWGEGGGNNHVNKK